jgi:lysophospholipase L1-like esterase
MYYNYKHIIRLLIIVLIAILSIWGLELGAGFIWQIKYRELLETELHGFDKVDSSRGIIIPIPNTVMTVADLRAHLKKHNKPIGLKNLEKSIKDQGLDDTTVLLRINRYGFKGPDIVIPKPTKVFRILTIGDSCTWGSDDDNYTYPRAMEQALNAHAEQHRCNTKIEVVNAGVMGYNFERVLKRIDEYLAVEPDLITVYLGWNRTISRADPQKSLYLYQHLDLYKIFYHSIINRTRRGFTEDYSSWTYYDKNDLTLEGYKNYSFEYDLQDLHTLVNYIQRHNQSIQIVLITIGGLLDWRVEPDERALSIAYPIAATDNLYAYSLLTKLYNQNLRDYARSKHLPMIDFEQYAFDHFSPRSTHFIDSVHPTPETYVEMGQYFASELTKFFAPCNDLSNVSKH